MSSNQSKPATADSAKSEAPKATAPEVKQEAPAAPAVSADDFKSLADGLKALSAELAETRKENAELRKDGEQTRADLEDLRDAPISEEDRNPSQPGTLPTLDEELEHHLKAQTPAVIIAAVTGLSAKELRAKAKKLGYELDESKEGSNTAPPEGGIGSKDATE